MSGITSVGTDWTAIGLVIDRSGSMWSVAEDTKGGVKEFITSQKKQEGKAALTLVQFDHEYQVLKNFAELGSVDENEFLSQYQPRGSTALLDAIGRTIQEMGQKMAEMTPAERPARVIVTIVTDGQENASKEYTASKIKALVEEKRAAGWNFVFLGADLDSIQVAESYGFDRKQSAYYKGSNISSTLETVSEKVKDARNGQEVLFSTEERDKLAGG